MKSYSIVSAEKNRVTVAAENFEAAEPILKRAFEANDFWGYDPAKIEELPYEGILPEPGEVMISYTCRV